MPIETVTIDALDGVRLRADLARVDPDVIRQLSSGLRPPPR